MAYSQNGQSNLAESAPGAMQGQQPIMPELDRRRHQRVGVSLLGRFMRENKQEYPCRTLNMSPGGIALQSPVYIDDGERIIVYLDHIGRVEGVAARNFDRGFAMRIDATPYKREKIASQLTWIANQHALNLSDGRRYQRLIPRNKLCTLTFEDGASYQCHILDMSLGGASVSVNPQPEVGMMVQLGKLRGRVVRHHENGIGIEFVDIQNPNALSKYFS